MRHADRVAAATIVSKNVLPCARVLAESFRAHHPKVRFFVLLADEVEDCFDPEREPFELIPISRIALPSFRRFVFQYTRPELSYALTPHLIGHLLENGFTSVIFLKQESMVTGSLEPLFAQLERHAILLTPHLLSPLAGDDAIPRELNILLSGAYNGGFLGVSAAPSARRFLAWWQDRLSYHCVLDVAHGLHFEQRWLDLVPALFEGVHIVRDPGVNVAHWNLPDRHVTFQGDAILVDGAPARLFRFSGFEAERPQYATRYSRRLTMANAGPAAAIYRRYLDRLETAGYYTAKYWPYAFGSFQNGVPIPDLARRLCRELGPLAARFEDPFAPPGPGSFFDWLNEPVDRRRDGQAVTRLWRAIYDQRPDVRALFPDPLGRSRRGFLRWLRIYGAHEHRIPEAFLNGRSVADE